MTFLTRHPVFWTKFAFWGDMGDIQQNFGGNLVFAGGSGPRDWRSHHHTYNFFGGGVMRGVILGARLVLRILKEMEFSFPAFPSSPSKHCGSGPLAGLRRAGVVAHDFWGRHRCPWQSVQGCPARGPAHCPGGFGKHLAELFKCLIVIQKFGAHQGKLHAA